LHVATFLALSVKLPNLQLKTQPKQILGSLPLVIALPVSTDLGVINVAEIVKSSSDADPVSVFLTNF